jgi:hypothetical protein
MRFLVDTNIFLEVISFDGDFDRTEKGRKTPDGAGIINKKAE